MKKRMIHGLAALARRLYEDIQIGARGLLTDKLIEALWPQGLVAILRQPFGSQRRIRRLCPSVPGRAHVLGAIFLSAARIKLAESAPAISPPNCATTAAASPGA